MKFSNYPIKHVGPGIYCIKNLINGKIYVGSSNNIKNRSYTHLRALRNQKYFNVHEHLQNSWNFYGEENFDFQILETVEKLITETDIEFKKRLVEKKEQYYLDTLMPWKRTLGYNTNKIANSPAGVKRSAETCEKMRIANIGEKNPNFGKTGKNSPRFGMKHSKKTKKIMSAKRLGKALPDKTKEKMSLSRIGEKNPSARKIVQLDDKLIFIKAWNTMDEAQKFFKLKSKSGICLCCQGKRKKAAGFVWKYYEDFIIKDSLLQKKY
jgi:group I intron endonuclease